MRLIDADKLIAFIDVGKYTNPNALTFSENHVCEMINDQPTAYDVDAVIEELKASCCENRYCVDCFDCYFKQAINKAIEIVKRGGIE